MRQVRILVPVTQTRSLLTAGEVAEMLDKSLRTVQRMAARGELPFEAKLPGTTGSYLFSRSVVEMYQQARSA